MKKLIFIALSFLTTISVFGQFEAGIKIGANTADYSDASIINIIQDGKQITISPQEADYGVHFGLYTRISALGFYLEPAIIFNSSTTNYKIDDFSEAGVVDDIKTETYRTVDIPVLFGTKLAFLRIQGGPVAHFFLDSVSDLGSLNGYSQNLQKSTYGFQAGLGLDIWKFRLDVNYEGNLAYFGNNITIDGQEFTFDESPSRLIASLGIKF